MKRTIKAFAVTALLLTTSITSYAGRYVDISCKIQGLNRTGFLYLPDGIKADAPLIVVAHGYGGSADKKNGYGMDQVADKNGFAVLYPQGIKDPVGHTCWNVGYPSEKGMTVDDVNTICKMAQFVQKQYKLSKTNTFLTGMSNGGELCYLTAYSKQKTFKAVAPIAGLTLVWMLKEHMNSSPIPLFEVHGTEDRISEWTGDLINQYGWGAYLPVPIAVNYWVAVNHCTQEKVDTVASINPQSNHKVIRHKFIDGINGNQVWLYEVTGAPHCWHEGDLNTAEEIWKFFSMYVK